MILAKAKSSVLPTATTLTNSQDFSSTSDAKNIKYHFGQNNKNVNATSIALHQSILSGRLKQVKYFLKLGINSNVKDIYGRTCLMLACLSDLEDYGLKIAKLLIHYGADVNARDFMGRSAVFLACSQKREKLLEFFIDKHTVYVDFHQKDNDGDILLNHAAMYGTPKMIKLVLRQMHIQKLPVDERNNLGYTALLLVRHFFVSIIFLNNKFC